MADNPEPQDELEKLRQQLDMLEALLRQGVDVSAQKDEIERDLQAKIESSASAQQIIGDNNVQVGHDLINLRNAHATLNFFTERNDRAAWLKKYLATLMTERHRLPQEVLDSLDGERRLQLWQVYTALDVASGRGRRPALTELNTSPHLVLLGGPGTGKTTFADFVTLCMAGEMLRRDGDPGLHDLRQHLLEKSEDQEDIPQLIQDESLWTHGALLPLSVRLREFAASKHFPSCKENATAQCLLNFVREGARPELALEPQFYEILVKYLTGTGGEGVLLVLDGLDEISHTEESRAPLKETVGKFLETYPKCRVLVTSLPYTYDREQWRLNGFARAEFAPFDPPQVRLFAWQWYCAIEATNRQLAEERAQTLANAVLRDERLRSLSRIPLLLAMMAMVHRRDKGQLPRGRAVLYERVTDLLLKRWNRQQNEQELEHALGLPLADIRAVVERLAYEVHSAEEPGEEQTALLPKGRLLEALDEERKQQDARGVPIGEIAEFLGLRTGILLPEGNNAFRFPHRSFQEFMAACYLSDQQDVSEVLPPLIRQDPVRWREVGLLAIARVSAIPTAFRVLIDELCPDEPLPGPDSPVWRGAVVASLALGELATKRDKVFDRAHRSLTKLITTGALPSVERAEAGRILAALGDDRPGVCDLDIQWCEIPAGTFLMGSTNADRNAQDREKPQHEVELEAYSISKYPVTWAQYEQFVEAGGYGTKGYWTSDGWAWRQKDNIDRPRYWQDDTYHIANHPANGISWYEAMAYCAWLSEQLGVEVRLPTETEWEKAARGKDGRICPWGNEFDAGRCNVRETGIGRTSAVGMFPLSKDGPWGEQTPLDMGGNVWERCSSWYAPYPYDADDGREIINNIDNRTDYQYCVLRGGGFGSGKWFARAASRSGSIPSLQHGYIGFRLTSPFLFS